MNTMKRTLFATAFLSLALLGASCGANQTTVQTTNTSTTNSTNTSSSSTTNTNSATSTTASVKEFTITADQFSFSPSTITVSTGDTVKLHLTSSDTTHGFSLAQFGVSETLQPGKTVDTEFVADKAGTYTFSCSVVCGSGHASMKGTLVVQ